MPYGFPRRQVGTGQADAPRASRVAALLLTVGVVLSGCGAGEPQHPPAPVTATPEEVVAAPTPAIPEYTTKLKLTAKEKQAADGAAAAVAKYFAAATKFYGSSGQDTTAIKVAASLEHFTELKDSTSDIFSKNYKLSGTLRSNLYDLYAIQKSDRGDKGLEAGFNACITYSKTKMTNAEGKNLSSWTAHDKQAQFYLIQEGGSWVLDDMSISKDQC
ncbi:hypothetical protein NQ036_14530 [Brevibacterium sp. 91QC2O2]|nr:hypothetical protein [Brevibacterium sp. 91QC2O2]